MHIIHILLVLKCFLLSFKWEEFLQDTKHENDKQERA